jgi:hypothetical protein
MTRCEVQGLLLGGCSEYTQPGEVLCTYHLKLYNGLLLPPGDDGFFTKDHREAEPLPAVVAHISYLNSTYPQFAHLVPTEVTVDAVPASRRQDRVPA